MKKILLSVLLVSFAFVIRTLAQEKTYLLVEYLKVNSDNKEIAGPIVSNICERIQSQRKRDSSIVQCSVWELVNTDENNGYRYIVATLINSLNNEYIARYLNRNSQNIFINVSNDSSQTEKANSDNTVEVIHASIYEVMAETTAKVNLPKYLVCTEIKAAPGKRYAYESIQISDWLPIHRDLIRKGFESAFNFNKLLFPGGINSPYDYSIFQFFDSEAMYSKQNSIDWEPYIQRSQAAFINTGMLGSEVHSELLRLVALVN